MKDWYFILVFVFFSSTVHSQETSCEDFPENNIEKRDGSTIKVQWISPENSVGLVGQFDKMELGINLPESISKQIQVFINKTNGKELNPYNPEDIDVWAIIECLEVHADPILERRVNAFYFEDFVRDTTKSLADWDWIKQKNKFDMRIRHATGTKGSHKVQIHAVVKGGEKFVSDRFSFEVVDSKKKGFVNIGATQRYFELADNSTFFPSGGNLQPDYCGDPRWKSDFISKTGKYANNGYDPKARFYHPLFYVDYMKTLEEYGKSGSNYFRFLSLSWTNEIEYEVLNDYSKRMHMAWEMDRIIDKAEEHDMKIEWCIQAQYSLENPGYYGHFNWDWPSNTEGCRDRENNGYCYQTELGLKEPIEFFTNEKAKKYWKRKLRYIISRWGYSEQIAMFQLMSEINGTGIIPNYQLTDLKDDRGQVLYQYCKIKAGEDYISKPYYDKPGYKEAVYEWHKEMAAYIKKELLHTNQLIAPSYAGEPRANEGDATYQLEDIDVCSFNYYTPYARKFFMWTERSMDHNKSFFNSYVGGFGNSDPLKTRKPIVFSEIGIANFTLCDEDIGDIKMMLISPFTGVAGMGMNWDNNRLDRSENWFLYRNVKDFMQAIDLNNVYWLPQTDETVKDEIKYLGEMVCLTSDEDYKRACGVVHNRSWNFYTRGRKKNVDQCGFDYSLGDTENQIRTFSQYKDLLYDYPFGPNPLKVNDMGALKKYTIDWYDPFTMKIVKTQETRTSLSGKISLEYPAMSTDKGYQPIYWFKARRSKAEDFSTNELPRKKR